MALTLWRRMRKCGNSLRHSRLPSLRCPPQPPRTSRINIRASALYSKPVEVIPHVWSAIGATAPPTYENSGHNNNLSFIVTGDGVVVVNGGAAYVLAKALHDEIKVITDQPVKLVIDENGQGHAMLGNSYWSEQGVPILAHVDAAHEFEERGHNILENMKRYNRDKAEGTFIALPTETFEDPRVIEMGDFTIEVMHLGPSHGPGDTQVWLPKQSLVIAGDMAFHERMLPIFEDTIVYDWIETWETGFEKLGATYVIPGHGHPTKHGSGTALYARLSGSSSHYRWRTLREWRRSGRSLLCRSKRLHQPRYV